MSAYGPHTSGNAHSSHVQLCFSTMVAPRPSYYAPALDATVMGYTVRGINGKNERLRKRTRDMQHSMLDNFELWQTPTQGTFGRYGGNAVESGGDWVRMSGAYRNPQDGMYGTYSHLGRGAGMHGGSGYGHLSGGAFPALDPRLAQGLIQKRLRKIESDRAYYEQSGLAAEAAADKGPGAQMDPVEVAGIPGRTVQTQGAYAAQAAVGSKRVYNEVVRFISGIYNKSPEALAEIERILESYVWALEADDSEKIQKALLSKMETLSDKDPYAQRLDRLIVVLRINKKLAQDGINANTRKQVVMAHMPDITPFMSEADIQAIQQETKAAAATVMDDEDDAEAGHGAPPSTLPFTSLPSFGEPPSGAAPTTEEDEGEDDSLVDHLEPDEQEAAKHYLERFEEAKRSQDWITARQLQERLGELRIHVPLPLSAMEDEDGEETGAAGEEDHAGTGESAGDEEDEEDTDDEEAGIAAPSVPAAPPGEPALSDDMRSMLNLWREVEARNGHPNAQPTQDDLEMLQREIERRRATGIPIGPSDRPAGPPPTLTPSASAVYRALPPEVIRNTVPGPGGLRVEKPVVTPAPEAVPAPSPAAAAETAAAASASDAPPEVVANDAEHDALRSVIAPDLAAEAAAHADAAAPDDVSVDDGSTLPLRSEGSVTTAPLFVPPAPGNASTATYVSPNRTVTEAGAPAPGLPLQTTPDESPVADSPDGSVATDATRVGTEQADGVARTLGLTGIPEESSGEGEGDETEDDAPGEAPPPAEEGGEDDEESLAGYTSAKEGADATQRPTEKQISNMTNKQLIAALRSAGVSGYSGKAKPALINMLRTHYGYQGAVFNTSPTRKPRKAAVPKQEGKK